MYRFVSAAACSSASEDICQGKTKWERAEECIFHALNSGHTNTSAHNSDIRCVNLILVTICITATFATKHILLACHSRLHESTANSHVTVTYK